MLRSAFIIMLLSAFVFGANVQKKLYDDVKNAVKSTDKYSVVILGVDYCPFCKTTIEAVGKLAPKYDKVQFFYVNIDFDEEARSDYSVRATPNILFFAPSGKLIEKKIGGMNEIGFAKKLDTIGIK